MSVRRIAWAMNLPNGTPVVIEGAFAEVDDETGVVTLTSRSQQIISEVIRNQPQATDTCIVPSIDLAHEAHLLVQAKHQADIPLDALLPPEANQRHSDDDLPDNTNPSVAPQTQDTIDRALRLVYSQSFRAQQKLGQPAHAVSLSDLRESPLGRDLTRLARIANSDETADYDAVTSMIDSVLELLFRPAGEDQYQVPRSFWNEPLGTMLSRAKWRNVDHGDLISVGEAADRLGVIRPTIYRWMDDQTLDCVRDTMSGRIFVLRHEIERMKKEAAQLPSKHTLHSMKPFSDAPDEDAGLRPNAPRD